MEGEREANGMKCELFALDFADAGGACNVQGDWDRNKFRDNAGVRGFRLNLRENLTFTENPRFFYFREFRKPRYHRHPSTSPDVAAPGTKPRVSQW